MEKQEIGLMIMILFMCIAMFMLGYFTSYQKAVNNANKIIIENCGEDGFRNNYKPELPGTIKFNLSKIVGGDKNET